MDPFLEINGKNRYLQSRTTVTTKVCVAVSPLPSITCKTTRCSPNCELVGVPKSISVPSPWSVSASQPGSVVAVIVSISPWIKSRSLVVME